MLGRRVLLLAALLLDVRWIIKDGQRYDGHFKEKFNESDLVVI